MCVCVCVCGHTRHAVKSTERHVSRVSIGFLARDLTLLEKVAQYVQGCPVAAVFVCILTCVVQWGVHCTLVRKGRRAEWIRESE